MDLNIEKQIYGDSILSTSPTVLDVLSPILRGVGVTDSLFEYVN